MSEENSSMEEEWMRDLALLRDLLHKDPHASPRALTQAIGRSVSWVKKWRQRLREGDLSDPALLCSRSRAHHAPYFRWDPLVETRLVEMRLSPPEHLGRTPGPGLCSIICRVIRPCKPQEFACPSPAERSGSFSGKQGVSCPSSR